MEAIWFILGSFAWILGIFVTLWEIGKDGTIRKDFIDFQASIDKENRMMAFLLSMMLCILIVLICAFWPVCALIGIGRRIIRKVGQK